MAVFFLIERLEVKVILLSVVQLDEESASRCVLPACVQSRWAPALWGRNGADLT